MILAKDETGERIFAEPKMKAICPCCDGVVISKCGDIKVWHWSHESGNECDSWYKPETEWHVGWKRLVKPEFCEVVKGPHRADIVANNGTVIELQHSAISTDDIQARENFYNDMVWLFDVTDYKWNIDERDNGGFHTFRWKHPHKSVWECKKPIYWDFGPGWQDQDRPERIFFIKKLNASIPCGGWGYFISQNEFIRRFLSSVSIADHIGELAKTI